MQTINERNQHKETKRNEMRNSREEKEKQNRLASDADESANQNAVNDESSTSGSDTINSLNKSSVSLRRKSKYFRNDTL